MEPSLTNTPTVIYSNWVKKLIFDAYLEDFSTLCDGVRLHHEVGNAGHDGGAVVARPVAEDALHLAETEALASVAGSDESGVEAVGHVTPVCAECLQRRKIVE